MSIKIQLLELGYKTNPFTQESLDKFPLRSEDKALLRDIGLPTATPPNGLRFANPKGEGTVGLHTLNVAWTKFSNHKMAAQCVVIGSDSNGNTLFINTSDKGEHQVSFYDHDFDIMRYVSPNLPTFLDCLLVFLRFVKKFSKHNEDKALATKEDYLLLKKQLSTIDPESTIHADTFWAEMIFFGKL